MSFLIIAACVCFNICTACIIDAAEVIQSIVSVTFHYLITKYLLNIFSAIIQVISTTNKLCWLLCEQLILTPPNSNMEVKCERKACVCI